MLQDYLRLIRFDKPIGTLLLLGQRGGVVVCLRWNTSA